MDHLSRIQGQMETLKRYMAEGNNCADIAQLTTSIAKSFDALRAKTLEGFIKHDLLEGKAIPKKELQQLEKLLNLHKK